MFKIDLTGRFPKLDSTFYKNNADFYGVQVDIPPIYEVNTINKFISTDTTDYDKIVAG